MNKYYYQIDSYEGNSWSKATGLIQAENKTTAKERVLQYYKRDNNFCIYNNRLIVSIHEIPINFGLIEIHQNGY